MRRIIINRHVSVEAWRFVLANDNTLEGHNESTPLELSPGQRLVVRQEEEGGDVFETADGWITLPAGCWRWARTRRNRR